MLSYYYLFRMIWLVKVTLGLFIEGNYMERKVGLFFLFLSLSFSLGEEDC